jgi:hypothetical protein
VNGTSRTPGFEPDDGELDPELTRLFDDAAPPLDAEAFVSITLAKLETARRTRLVRSCATVAVAMIIGAFLAPYVASATMGAASWLEDHLPDTVLALGSCACAALIAWRTARGQLS